MTERKLNASEMAEVLLDSFSKDYKIVTVYNGQTDEMICITVQDIVDALTQG